MIQKGFETVCSMMTTPFLENRALVGKRVPHGAGNTPSSDSVLIIPTVLFLTLLSNFPQEPKFGDQEHTRCCWYLHRWGYFHRPSLWANYLVKVQGCLLDTQPPFLGYSRPHSSIPTPSLSIVMNRNYSQHKACGSLYHSSQLA